MTLYPISFTYLSLIHISKMSVPYSRLEGMMSKNENRLNFRMTDETAAKIERWYQEDNCRSKNEFSENAVNCYAAVSYTHLTGGIAYAQPYTHPVQAFLAWPLS